MTKYKEKARLASIIDIVRGGKYEK